MDVVKWILILAVSIFVLLKASDYFISAAEKYGLYFGISPFVVGILFVGIGTSLPELISSIISVTHNSSEIVVGNALGSNITNICLVLGIAAVTGKKFIIKHDIMKADIPFLLGSAVLLSFMIYDKQFSVAEALILLAGLVFYLIFCVTDRPVLAEGTEIKIKQIKPGLSVFLKLVLSPLFIYLGAEYTVRSVISFSEIIGIGKEIIAMSAVALGTSLPEIVVTVKSAKKGNVEMAVGNITGSNIFNTLAVMGIPALIGPLAIPPGTIISFIIPMFLAVTVLYIIIVIDKTVYRIQGYLLLLFYIFFIMRIFKIV